MFCIYCGKNIDKDSRFCPYCGKDQTYRAELHCVRCGQKIESSSAFCPYCGESAKTNLSSKSTHKICYNKKIDFHNYLSNRFFIWYIVWFIIQCLLLSKSTDAYSDYFNESKLSPGDHWGINRNIYPVDWLYPYSNIFHGIMGQDPVYVYDASEFILYSIFFPLMIILGVYYRKKLFRKVKNAIAYYWITWYCLIWMTLFFPMGLLGLDFLGWSFTMGAILVGIYGYLKIKKKIQNRINHA